MNGEGDFILYPRRSLLRTLIYMQMAIEMGKQVRLLNTILSPPPARASDPVVIQAVGRMIPRCAVVAYRDPESMRLHQELYSASNAIWTPDALFTWWREGTKILGANVREAYYGPIAEGLPPEVQALLRDEAPIVVISGSSSVTSRNEDTRLAFQPIADLVTALKAAGFQPVLVATCSGDDWMAKAAASAGCPFVPARVPLVSGLLLMSRAKCFVSGRYHPSILASVVGAPVVLMASNSHKNLSLQQVMGHPDPREFPFFTQSADMAPLTEAVLAACETSAASRASLTTRMEQLERQVQTMTAPLPVSAAA
jgi:polysaccharide pyruvyl transferase WcaK-like protein